MSLTRTPVCHLAALAVALLPAVGHAQHTTDTESSAGPSGGSSPENASGETPSGPADSSSGSPTNFEYRLDEGTIVVRSTGGGSSDDPVTTLEVPCSARSLARGEDALYVACGEEGVYVYSLEDPRSPEGKGFRDVGGTVDALFEARGRIWAEIVRTEARPITGAAAPRAVRTVEREKADDSGESSAEDSSEQQANEPPKQKSTPEQKTASREESTDDEESDEADRDGSDRDESHKEDRPIGNVVEVRQGKVVVDLGKTDGLERDAKVELFRRESVDVGGESASREVPTRSAESRPSRRTGRSSAWGSMNRWPPTGWRG